MAASRGVRRPGDDLLRGLARTRRLPIALAAGGAIGHQAFEALVPVVIGATIDRAVAPGDGGQLLLWLAVLAATFVSLNTAFRVQVVVGVRVAEWAAHELRLRLADRVLDPRGIDPASLAGDDASASSGALLGVAGADAGQASLTLRGLVMTLGAISALVVASVVLVGVSWPLGLLVLAGTPVLLVVVQRLARPLQRRTADEQARAADASAVATDLVRGLRVLKGIGAERTAAARYRETSERSLRSTLRAAVAGSALEGGTTLVSGVLLAVVTIVAGRLALDGEISVGELVAAAGVTQFLVGPMQRLGMAGRLFAEGRASADRVARVLDAAPAVAPSAGADGEGDDAPQLHLRGLRVSGRGGVLDVRVAPGELLGLAAADPADAVAIVDVLARRRAPAAGAVLLGDRDVAGTAPPAERPGLLVADHEAELFEGTVEENVRALVPADARERDAHPAMEAADASEVVRALPRGARAPVGEGGGALSGGQRQRVALARALLAEPRALVLHEPTTAVDAVTEERIAGGVRRLRAGRTTLVVATSPALLRACDRVVLVSGGAAVAEGTHDALVRERAAYREAVLR